MSHLALGAALTALALVACWSLGALLLAAWRVAWMAPWLRPRLARWVPACLLAPPTLGVAVAAAVVLPTLGGCHCGLDAALHTCLAHPERSLALAPAAALVLVLAAFRLAPHLRDLGGRLRAASALGRGSRLLVEVDEPLGNAVSVALPRPRILVDREWWRLLPPLGRRIVLAHEGAHLRRRDPLLLELCGLAARLVPGGLARRCLSAWRDHAERQADAAAARAAGDPIAVASLLLEAHRRAVPAAFGLALQDGRRLEVRVRALLDGCPQEAAGSDLGRGAAALLVACLAVTALVAEALHHALEAALRGLA